MSRPPQPLPDPLSSEPFAVREGAWHGLSDKRLRASDLDRSVWGVRSVRTSAENNGRTSLAERCRKFALRMPLGAFFSHSTAALLLGAPLPLALERSEHLHIAVEVPARAPHAAGIRGHRLSGAELYVQVADGLVLTNAGRTWCDLANLLSLHDLIAVGDYFLQWRHPQTTVEELERVAAGFLGQRGMKRIRAALPLLNDRAESRPESVLRVMLALSGLPHPQINRNIVFTEDGTVVRTDFAFDQFRTLLEYQGDYHRTVKGQWRRDMTRRSRLEAQNWVVMELNANDLKDTDELVARIRAVLMRQGWRT